MTKKRYPMASSPRHLRQRIGSLQNEIFEINKRLDMCRSLSDEAADAICTADLNGTLTYANKATARLLKMPLKKIVGTHFRRFVHKGSLSKAYQYFTLAKSGKKVSDEVNIVDRTGNVIPVDFHTTPISKGGKVVAVHTIVRDIRRRKAMEQMQAEAQKMQAMYHFISAMAQEIKYPLKAISDRLTSTLQEFKAKDFEYIGYREFKQIVATIETIANQVLYCHDITHRMINLKRRTLGAVVSRCHVNEAVRQAVRTIEVQSGHTDVKFNLSLSPALHGAAISTMELHQVLMHLFVNAVQAMPMGGKVMVKTSLNKDKKRIIIQIRDEGVGIAKENLPHIFEPFFTTKQHGPHRNSGLGLSIVHSIVHAYRGDIHIHSSLRSGTTVHIELPVTLKQ